MVSEVGLGFASPDTVRKGFVYKEDPLAWEAFLVSLQRFQGGGGEVWPQFLNNVGDETTGSPFSDIRLSQGLFCQPALTRQFEISFSNCFFKTVRM